MVMDLSDLLVSAMMFFALALFAQPIRSDLKFSPGLTKALTIYLPVGVGLHGVCRMKPDFHLDESNIV